MIISRGITGEYTATCRNALKELLPVEYIQLFGLTASYKAGRSAGWMDILVYEVVLYCKKNQAGGILGSKSFH